MADFNPEDLEMLPIKEGPPGRAATVKVAGVMTVAPDAAADVENLGNDFDAEWLIKIPRGETGEGADDPGDLTLLFDNKLAGPPLEEEPDPDDPGDLSDLFDSLLI